MTGANARGESRGRDRSSNAAREASQTRRRTRELELFGACQPLDRVFDAQSESQTPAALRREHFEWTATARVARAFTRVVLGDSRVHVPSDAAIERAVGAERQVDVPGTSAVLGVAHARVP